MIHCAPIILFTYNRLNYLQKTISYLKKNKLASESELFVFSDGWKNEKDKHKVLEVRKYLKTVNGFKNIYLTEQTTNVGLANSIISAVTKIINSYEKAIVLEDDIITSPHFLTFMNESLDIYQGEKSVGSIHGHIYNIENLPNTFFSYKAGCLGWATWKDKWNNIDFNGKNLLKKIKDKKLERKFDINGSYPFLQMLQDQINGKNQSWAVRLYASFLLNNMLTYYPGESLAQHIGLKEGTHCKDIPKITPIDGVLSTKKIVAKKIPIRNSFQATYKIEEFFHSLRGTKMKRFTDSDYQKLRDIVRFQEVEVRFMNFKIKVPDAASLLFLNHELFGLEIYKFETKKKTPLIIDCGANVGLSLIYFKKLYPNAEIIAFEPDKKIFDYLKYNIQSFKFKNIKLINKGLWKEETTLKFFSEGSDGGRIAIENDIDNIIQIETVKLSTYLKNNEIDFLKIDIEGAETEVLLECQDELKNVKNLFIEYHSFSNEKQTLSVILNILENNGFRYYIEHIGIKSNHPFCNISTSVGFDNQLNIFGYKKN